MNDVKAWLASLLIAPLCLAQDFERLVSESRGRVLAKYPEIGKIGSAWNRAYVSEVTRLRASKDSVFKASDWPERVMYEIEGRQIRALERQEIEVRAKAEQEKRAAEAAAAKAAEERVDSYAFGIKLYYIKEYRGGSGEARGSAFVSKGGQTESMEVVVEDLRLSDERWTGVGYPIGQRTEYRDTVPVRVLIFTASRERFRTLMR